MSVKADVLAVLRDAAAHIKPDLWTPEDLPRLEQVAHDLVDLGLQLAAAEDDQHRAVVRQLAEIEFRRVQLMALRRARVAEQAVRDEIESVFLEKVLPALLGFLPGLL